MLRNRRVGLLALCALVLGTLLDGCGQQEAAAPPPPPRSTVDAARRNQERPMPMSTEGKH